MSGFGSLFGRTSLLRALLIELHPKQGARGKRVCDLRIDNNVESIETVFQGPFKKSLCDNVSVIFRIEMLGSVYRHGVR